MLYLDFETYSDLDLTQVGAYKYAMDISTKALMLGWALDDEPVQLWDIEGGEPMPKRLLELLYSKEILKSAFNAQFERLILQHCLRITLPPSFFSCTMSRAYALGFKGGLGDVCTQFDMPQNKYARGTQLMKIFSMPGKLGKRNMPYDNPEEYEEYKKYCRMDVEAERALEHKISEYSIQYSAREYELDQIINDKGLPIDVGLVHSAIEVAEIEKKYIFDRLVKLTRLENPNSNPQFRDWLELQGIFTDNMQAGTVERLIDATKNKDPLVHGALVMKQQLGKTSTSKWEALDRAVGYADRLYGTLQFLGASRTGRWAGRLFQPHNLPRGKLKDPDTACELIKQGHEFLSMMYPSVMEVLSSTLRGAIQAKEGMTLVVSDLSSIESRVIGWLTGCERINNIFAEDKDTYKDLATQLFDTPYKDVTKEQRFVSKPAALGCQYMLGGKGLRAYATNYGVELTEEEAQRHVETYRSMYPEVVSFWYWLRDAVQYVVITGEPMEGYNLILYKEKDFLFIDLPSGRSLPYYLPAIEDRPAPWDKKQMIPAFTYMGVDAYSKQWRRISAHAGGVTENIVQGIARDILMIWLGRSNAEFQLRVVGHVHDEIILEVPSPEADYTLERINALIRRPISWAQDLLLNAGGFTSERYKKD